MCCRCMFGFSGSTEFQFYNVLVLFKPFSAVRKLITKIFVFCQFCQNIKFRHSREDRLEYNAHQDCTYGPFAGVQYWTALEILSMSDQD